MKFTIGKKIGFLLITMAVIAIINLAFVYRFISDQRYLSYIFNIAARQRMLSQKIMALSLSASYDDKDSAASSDDLKEISQSLDIYNSSLFILQNGGEIDGITIPKPPDFTDEIFKKNWEIWLPIKEAANSVMLDKHNIKAVRFIKNNSNNLLNISSKIASIFEGFFVERINSLKRDLIIMLVIDILIIIIGWILANQYIAKPLRYISKTAVKVGGGDLNQQIIITNLDDEIKELANSFNSMLKNLQNVFKDFDLSQKALVSSLAALADGRDPETGTHLERTRQYAMMLARELQKEQKFKDIITKEFIDDIYNAASLHDIGKVGISDSILLKPSKLSDEEFNEMKRHVTIGSKVLDSAINRFGLTQSLFVVARNICEFHHEKYNSKGYKKGLAGDAIPLEARIFSVCDVYDALRSKRPYKQELTHEQALEIIYKDKGESFDPYVIDALRKCEINFRDIHNSYKYLHGIFCQIFEANTVGTSQNLSYVTFGEKLHIGVKEIDDHHKLIFNQIQLMLKSINKGQWRSDIVTNIKLMGNYVNEHFRLEEDYMYKNNYPVIEFHKREHERLKINIINITNRIRDNNTLEAEHSSDTSELVLQFAQDMISHILTIDKAFGEFLAK